MSLTGRHYRICEKKFRELDENAQNNGNEDKNKKKGGLLAILEEEEQALDGKSDSDFDPMSDIENA